MSEQLIKTTTSSKVRRAEAQAKASRMHDLYIRDILLADAKKQAEEPQKSKRKALKMLKRSWRQ